MNAMPETDETIADAGDLRPMIREGYYAAAFQTLLGRGTARLKLADGMISGETLRGVLLTGEYVYDFRRRQVFFEIEADLPADFLTITGLLTPNAGRRVRFDGVSTPGPHPSRFSVGFAGRAIDVAVQFVGTLDNVGTRQGVAA